jgi:tetratricopeptide (TPR) repeat protein
MRYSFSAQTSFLLFCIVAQPSPAMAQSPGATTPQIAKPLTGSAASGAPVQEPPSVSKATHLYRDGKYDEARTEYDRVIQEGFSGAAAYAGLPRLELKQDRVAEATEAANQSMQLGPNLAATHVALGEVYFRQGKIEEAAKNSADWCKRILPMRWHTMECPK